MPRGDFSSNYSCCKYDFFYFNEVTLNVCDAILTIDSANGNENIYGSALNNSSETFSLRGGYDLIEHNLLVRKSWVCRPNI